MFKLLPQSIDQYYVTNYNVTLMLKKYKSLVFVLPKNKRITTDNRTNYSIIILYGITKYIYFFIRCIIYDLKSWYYVITVLSK